MQLTGFKVLSFGCYGTLIDRESGIFAALRPLLGMGNVTLNREEVLAAFVRHESALLESRHPQLAYSRLLAQAHRGLAKEWGVICSEDDHALFGRSVPRWPVFADAPAALQYFKRYFKLTILSNVDRESFAGTQRRLEARFDCVFTAEEIGAYKPDPRCFEHMLSRLAKSGWDRREVLHVAESPARDHAPAAVCGLASAWIMRRHRDDTGWQRAISSDDVLRNRFRFRSMVDMVKAHQEELWA